MIGSSQGYCLLLVVLARLNSSIFIYIMSKVHVIQMKSIFLVETMAAMVIAVATVSSLGISLVSAQMADNATMGNMTGGNMTSENTTATEETGSISSTGDESQEESPNPLSPEEEPSRSE
jgi:hypothetical protein